jgi:rhamnose utilization protein RhaD (predicted bifunctional aldolase and dehydrogenase)
MIAMTTAPALSKHLADVIELSHQLGREDRQLTILGEGNTSAIESETAFWVKGSGSHLGTIHPDQFSYCSLQAVLDMVNCPNMSEQDVDKKLRASLIEPQRPKPSIETLLHALCLTLGGAKYVGHTHAEACNQLLCSSLGAEPFMRHIFPDAVVVCGRVPMVVPYTEPGVPLALAVRSGLIDYKNRHGLNPKLILMVNHGIIGLGQTAREVLNINMMAAKWARVLIGAIQLGGAVYLAESSVAALDNRLDEKFRRQMLGKAK